MGLFDKYIDCVCYKPSSKSYENEIEKIQDNTEQVFTFKPTFEFEKIEGKSIADAKHGTYGISMRLIYGVLGAFVGSVFWILLMSNVLGFTYENKSVGWDSVLVALILFLPILISYRMVLKGMNSVLANGGSLRIDSSNYYKYEFRKLLNGKFVIIEGQNFNMDNPLMVSSLNPNVHLPFKAIYQITNIGKRTEKADKLVIRATFEHKILDFSTTGYQFFVHPYSYVDISIDRNLYTEDFLDVIGVKRKNLANDTEESSIFPSEIDPALEKDVAKKNKKYNMNLTYEDMMELSKCNSYRYSKDVMNLGMVLLYSCVVGFMFLLAVGVISVTSLVEQPIAVLLLIIGLIEYLWINATGRHVGIKKRLTQYFRDGDGNYFSVQFLEGASSTFGDKWALVKQDLKKAQDKVWAYYYVKRFKQGEKDYNFMTGGPAKVTPYPNLSYKRCKGLKKSVYTYEENGRKKKVVIPNFYDEFLQDLRRDKC